MNTSARPTWTDVRVREALLLGSRSLCVRDRVGAVIVDSTQRVIAQGYNGPPAGFPHGDLPCNRWCPRARAGQIMERGLPGLRFSSDYSDCPALHAEANALMVCDRRDREGGTIYVDSDICYACAKLIANSGLSRVVVLGRDNVAHRSPERSYQFLRDCGVEVVLT